MIGVFTAVFVGILLTFAVVFKVVGHGIAGSALFGRNEGVSMGLPEV